MKEIALSSLQNSFVNSKAFDVKRLRAYSGVYILENTPLGGGEYESMAFGGKNMKT
jgi:hypothetical protein